ncbi:stage II sporulation protein D [Paenibacillus pinihumi]|uniref:stage II sporulation protein D n=1 Tax=Paenibacillus pinihumi TaxID=669462 RepID=UPI00040DF68C|nr:stage II sporulation protein D [Paenibacillus pinihumi]
MKIVGYKVWFVIFLAVMMGVIILLRGQASLPPQSASNHDPVSNPRPVAIKPPSSAVPNPGKTGTTAPQEPSAEIRQQEAQAAAALAKINISVQLVSMKRTEEVPLELYVRGVLAGEMPADFELEALKAQAIAARTYIVRHMSKGLEEPVKITDTVQDQVYIPLKELKKRWGADTEEKLAKLTQAVEETAGQIITYKGEPIEALFFSTSNGYTENSEDYWGNPLPYLKSVASPWDVAASPKYKQRVTMKLSEFYSRLGVKKGAEKTLSILGYTEGRRVKKVKVGSKEFTGREFREKLALGSSQFTWDINGNQIELTTYGYGHGVGMSQWGADAMAKRGRSAKQIIAHYYSGTKVEAAPAWLRRFES